MKILLLLLLVPATCVFGQKANNQEMNNVLNTLVQNLQSNPNNPLNVTQEFLSNVAQQVPNESLKNVLNSYAKNFGTDKELSFRQVYFDLHTALDKNPDVAGNPLYNQAKAKLDLIFDNYSLITTKLKSLGTNPEFGSFINDPAILNSLSKLTGSYESAMALGAGIQMVADFAKVLAEVKQAKEDYRKLAKISLNGLYVETDPNLNKGLIDANLGYDGNYQITPVYRYDFDNGATLRVENGVLKYFNARKNIVKDLIVIEKRHNMEFYGADLYRDLYPCLLISPDEKYFYVYAQNNRFSSESSKNCLKNYNGYVINSETGETTYEIKKYAPLESLIHNTSFTSSNTLEAYDYLPFEKTEKSVIVTDVFNIDEKKLKKEELRFNNSNSFLINNERRNFHMGNNGAYFPVYQKGFYKFGEGQSNICLFWAFTKTDFINDAEKVYSSSMLQVVAPNAQATPRVVVNELTGLAMDKSKTLYFIDRNGSIGKLPANSYNLNDPNLPDLIKNTLQKNSFATYDFVANKTYTSDHGRRGTRRFLLLPTLKLTPDEKWLIYIVKNHLYLINPKDFNDVKEFTMTFDPYNSFFTKENGDWVLNVQALNDFKFPVTRKYSIARLSKIKTQHKAPGTVNERGAESNQPDHTTNSSLADEIKKLKDLLDQGVITEEEFKAAKAKLLNTKDEPKKNTTDPKKEKTKSTDNNSGGKTGMKEVGNDYADWLFIATDMALQYRFKIEKQEAGVNYYRIQVRINFEDKIFCKEPNCLGYVFTLGYPDLSDKDNIFRHYKFYNSFKGIYTIPELVPIKMEYPNGLKRILTYNGFYLVKNGVIQHEIDPLYNCVDNILSGDSKNRCVGKGVGKWRDVYDESKAVVVK